MKGEGVKEKELIKIPKKDFNINRLIVIQNKRDFELLLKYKGGNLEVNLNRLIAIAFFKTRCDLEKAFELNYNRKASECDKSNYRQLVYRRFGGELKLREYCGLVS